MMDQTVHERTKLLRRLSDASDPESVHRYRRRSSAALQGVFEDEDEDDDGHSDDVDTSAIWTTVPVLLIGVFVANADGSLVIASSQSIASEFNALTDASWLVTSYVLAQCAIQPLYGKLSDIFGRKDNLAVSYIFFAAGCLLCAVSTAYWQILAGRAISGIGGAGMTALVSIIIADMVPVRNVAAWRGFVNVAATVGRSLGGPVGGLLIDTVGWRWSFGGQVPLTMIGLLLLMWRVPAHTENTQESEQNLPLLQKVKRIDTAGAVALAATISSFLLTLDFVAKEYPWYIILAVAVVCVVFGSVFYAVERWWAKEPILPIKLITKRAAFTSYLIAGVQTAAQFGFFYAIPLYFQLAAEVSVSQAGLRLVPSVIGNATGGLFSGLLITKTGRYKYLTILGSVAATTAYTVVLLRWHGATGWSNVWYTFFGGFGMGTIQSTTFIHLAASLDQSEMAIAGTALYVAQNVFMLIGIQLATTVLHAGLRTNLENSLQGIKHKSKVMLQRIMDDRVTNDNTDHRAGSFERHLYPATPTSCETNCRTSLHSELKLHPWQVSALPHRILADLIQLLLFVSQLSEFCLDFLYVKRESDR